MRVLTLAVCLLAPVAAVVQCAYHGSAGCSAPKWPVRWDMAGSTYMYCFGHCQLDWLANNTQLGVWGGLVGVDHYWTHQGMPCIDGIPQEFAYQDTFAIQTKTRFPTSRVLQYRITDAVPYAGIVHDLMLSNPEYFVRWPNGSICGMPYEEHQTCGPNDGCTWPIIASAYDFSNPTVRAWYLENIIMPTLVHADGAWIDGDGPDNGAWMCSGNYDYGNLPAPYPALNETGIAAFCEGENEVVTQAQQALIAAGGFDYNCINFVSSPSNLPQASDSPSQCAAKLLALAAQNVTSATVIYGTRTDSAAYDDATAAQAVAAFLIVRGERWYFGFPSYAGNMVNATTAALMLTNFGAPLGNLTTPSLNVFQRQYENATVTLNCNNFTASFVPA